MSDFERRLQQEMERLASPASMPLGAKERVMTRSTRRRIVLPTVAALAVVIMGGGIFATAGSLWDSSSPQNPAGRDGRAGHRCLRDKATIVGTSGNDELQGTAGPDVIMGLGGNDEIDGLGSQDLICGGPGADTIDAGDGSDDVWGGSGSDELRGGAGRDSLDFGDAGGPVTVQLVLGIASGEGDDSVIGFEEIWGSRFGDNLTGSQNVDHIEGAGGNDQIYGLGDDDEIFPGEGDDLVDGGRGHDVYGFEFLVGPMAVDLAQGEAIGEGDDDLLSIESVLGSQFDDVFVGSDADETFKGLGGDDSIDGGGGDDSIDGGPGDDTCTNGERSRDC
jgi:Ca2+-binding RTX toxin-like protein